MEVFGNLRTDLGGVTVDGLAAGDDEVVFDDAECAGQCVGGGERVSAGELAVGEEDGAVGTHSHSLAEDGLGLRRSHRDDGDVCAKLVFQLEGHFEAALIVRVHNARHTVANQRARYGVDLDFGGVRNLLDTNYYFHIYF